MALAFGTAMGAIAGEIIRGVPLNIHDSGLMVNFATSLYILLLQFVELLVGQCIQILMMLCLHINN